MSTVLVSGKQILAPRGQRCSAGRTPGHRYRRRLDSRQHRFRARRPLIVIDASAAVAGLLQDGPARQALGEQQIHAPHLIDSEVASTLRRLVIHQQLDRRMGWKLLDTWRRLGVTRYPGLPLLDRMWDLRDNLTSYDATYVSLAESLGCVLLTADARLTRAPDLRCPVTLIPR